MKEVFEVLDEISSRQRITNNPILSSSICQKFRPHCPKEILLEKGTCDCAPGARGPRITISALNPVRTCPFQTKDRLRRRDRYAENRFCISDGS